MTSRNPQSAEISACRRRSGQSLGAVCRIHAGTAQRGTLGRPWQLADPVAEPLNAIWPRHARSGQLELGRPRVPTALSAVITPPVGTRNTASRLSPCNVPAEIQPPAKANPAPAFIRPAGAMPCRVRRASGRSPLYDGCRNPVAGRRGRSATAARSHDAVQDQCAQAHGGSLPG